MNELKINTALNKPHFCQSHGLDHSAFISFALRLFFFFSSFFRSSMSVLKKTSLMTFNSFYAKTVQSAAGPGGLACMWVMSKFERSQLRHARQNLPFWAFV